MCIGSWMSKGANRREKLVISTKITGNVYTKLCDSYNMSFYVLYFTEYICTL